MMVIVQIASDNPKPVESLKASDLKPYEANTQDPYITAYLKTDALPLTFVIGDGKEYNSEKQKYFNQPLKQNTSYIAFLRFFETQVISVNTELLCSYFGRGIFSVVENLINWCIVF
jgi:hypothetical protein